MNQGIPTPNGECSTDVRNVLIDSICEEFAQLDGINADIFLSLLGSVNKKKSFDIKTALDRSVDFNGSSPELLEFYTKFGVVPYVLELEV